MLPDVLASSYRRYKEDTNVFTTWLSQAAKACGWKPDTEPQATPVESPTINTPKAPRLKGKERKLARDAAKAGNHGFNDAAKDSALEALPTVRYTTTTRDLFRQMAAVSGWTKEKIRMPSNVQRVLGRAISARKRCAAWFQRTDSRNKFSNDNHRYFIGVLQKAADTLRGEDEPSDDLRTQSRLPESTTPEVDVMRNYFSALNLEHIEDDNEEDITASEVASLTVSSKNRPAQKMKETCVVYELEENSQSEFAFKIFCLFEDLHTLQGELRRMWKAQLSGDIDLFSATIVTTAAIDLVSRVEKEIHWAHPGLLNSTRSYQDLALTIFYSESLRQGEDPDAHIDSDKALDLEITPFKEFMYLPTGRTLMKIAQMRHIFEKGVYPIPIPPMRFSYIARPELLESPQMRKFEKEDEIICQFIQDLALQEDLKKGWQEAEKKSETLQWKVMPLFDDAFTGAMRKVWKDGEVTLQSVFAARILLDILDICGPNFKGQQLLIDEGNRAQSIFLFTNDDGVLDTGGGVRWLRKDQDLIQEIYSRITFHMLEPTFPSFRQYMLAQNPQPPDDVRPSQEELERMSNRITQVTISPSLRKRNDADHEISLTQSEQYEENFKRLNPKPIRPNRDPNFMTNRNPLYCGTILINLAALTEEAGVALANHHLSIFATAHLYNALRQMGLTQIRWPEMDKIAENHVGPIFAGSIPTTPEAMQSRISYRLGGVSNSKLYDKKQPWKVHSSPVTHTLMQFFESKEPLEKILYQLEEQIHNKEQSLVAHSKPNSQASQKRTTSRRQLTPLQFISKLEKYIPTVLPDVTINYITLTKTCNELLRGIRVALRQKLNVRYISKQIPGDSNDHGLALMVAAILHDNSNAAKSARKGETFGGGSQLRVALESFEEFWRKRENIPAEVTGLGGSEGEDLVVI